MFLIAECICFQVPFGPVFVGKESFGMHPVGNFTTVDAERAVRANG